MITLSSHLKKDESMVKTAVITGIINTLIAILAGFMIFPSLFSAGLSPIPVLRSSLRRFPLPSRTWLLGISSLLCSSCCSSLPP